MGDDHGTAGELQQGVFQRSQGFHVQIVRRFVQQQQVSALFQGQSQVEAVAFPT